MELTPYLDTVRHDLAAVAEAGGPEARALAERLAAPLDSSVRLVLLDALSAAAAEITRDLAPGSVDLRLRGREPSFVVTAPPAERPIDEPAAGSAAPTTARPVDGDEPVARINLRLGQDLKDRVEDAAREAGLSVNAWLVRAAAAALTGAPEPARSPGPRPARGPDRYSGWVR